MLKIKDNVDLKTLEQFKFKLVKTNTNNDLDYYTCQNKLIIFVNRRTIKISCKNLYDDDLTILYDLIKADLVEKVD